MQTVQKKKRNLWLVYRNNAGCTKRRRCSLDHLVSFLVKEVEDPVRSAYLSSGFDDGEERMALFFLLLENVGCYPIGYHMYI